MNNESARDAALKNLGNGPEISSLTPFGFWNHRSGWAINRRHVNITTYYLQNFFCGRGAGVTLIRFPVVNAVDPGQKA